MSNYDMRGRPVEAVYRVYKKDGSSNARVPEDQIVRGRFMIFGYKRIAPHGLPPTMQTMAIIERDDGKVISALPETVRFLDV